MQQQIDTRPETVGAGRTPVAGRTGQQRVSFSFRAAFRDYGMLWLLGLTLAVTAVVYPNFFTPINLQNVLVQNTPLGIVAVAVTLLLIAGGLDFSPAGTFALSAVVFALMADRVPLGLALIIALVTGLLCGLLTALAVELLRVTDFIATLGTGSILGGLAFLISGSSPVIPENLEFSRISTTLILGIPLPIIVLALVLAVGWFLLEGTVFGRWLYVVGGNREAGRLAGVNVRVVKASAFVIVAVAAALASILASSRLGVAQGGLGGNLALDAFTVVIIGGTSMFGGEGRMWRTVVGFAIIASINNVFDALAVDSSWQSVAKGAILVCAVALDGLAHRRR